MRLVCFVSEKFDSVYINPAHVAKVTESDRHQVRTVKGQKYTRSFSAVSFSNGRDVVVGGDIEDVVLALESEHSAQSGWYDETGAKCRYPGPEDLTPAPKA